MAKCQNHKESMSLIEKLRNLPGVEEVKTQIVLDRIKEDHTIIIPEPEI
jgi:DNA-binding Lrp family transcriptional regulator